MDRKFDVVLTDFLVCYPTGHIAWAATESEALRFAQSESAILNTQIVVRDSSEHYIAHFIRGARIWLERLKEEQEK